MKRRILLFTALLVFSVNASLIAQDKNAIVLTIDGQGTTVEEFENIFKKNNRDSAITPKSLDEYMELFINFKLKVAEAKKMGLDTVDKFVKELAGYRTQLARPYLVDATLLDGLIAEGYQRLSEEIHGYHILIKCDPGAAPSDTLRAYQKIIQLRNKILNGADFQQVARESSEDPSAKENGGDLSYFTAFQMVYPFESAAYNTPVGQVSMPVRTKYGFHLVKVVDRRDARGEIHVAHIMIRDKTEDPNYSKNKINEIYQKLLSKEKNFEELAAAYSEDGSSAKKGGELPWFGINKMVTEFEDAAFDLKSNNDVSQPVKTSYGWHIIKRLDYKPLAPFATMEKELKSKVQKDSRAEKTRSAFLKKLKAEYQYEEIESTVLKLIELADTNVYKAKWAPKKSLGKKTLCSIQGNKVSAQSFIDYINEKRPTKSKISPHDYISSELAVFCNDQVLKYEDKQLESKYPAFRLLMNEYRDGILLFELTDQKVWTKAVKDTTGLRQYYENNKYKYTWPDRAEISVFTCENSEYSQKVRALIAKGDMEHPAIELELNTDGKQHVELDGGTYSEEDRPLLAQFDWRKEKINTTDLMVNGKSVVVCINKFLPTGPKKLTEARGVITSDYQNYLEKTWIESLRRDHQIQVNKAVLYTIH